MKQAKKNKVKRAKETTDTLQNKKAAGEIIIFPPSEKTEKANKLLARMKELPK